MVDLTIKDTKATGGGCDCGCSGHEDAAAMAPVTAPSCGCGPECTCGCQEGKPCTCGPAEGTASCGCGPECTCGCQEGKPCTCGPAASASADPAPEGATVAHYTVTGMTCGHCVKAVTEEVSAIPGVTGVQVDLDSGALTVTSEGPIDFDRIVEAVDEAGDYTVA